MEKIKAIAYNCQDLSEGGGDDKEGNWTVLDNPGLEKLNEKLDSMVRLHENKKAEG